MNTSAHTIISLCTPNTGKDVLLNSTNKLRWDSILYFQYLRMICMMRISCPTWQDGIQQRNPVQYSFEMDIQNRFLLHELSESYGEEAFQHFHVNCYDQSARFHSCIAASWCPDLADDTYFLDTATWLPRHTTICLSLKLQFPIR